MSGTRKRHATPKPLRVCAYCHAPIAEQRPPYLLQDTSGMILGPFHAGCAERLSLQAKSGHSMIEGPFSVFGKTVLKAREETLPW